MAAYGDVAQKPLVTNLKDVTWVKSYKNKQYEHHSIWYLTPDDKVWHGTLCKEPDTAHPTLDEVNQHLKPISDDEVWPTKPASIKIAPDNLDNVYIKRPGFNFLDDEDLGPKHASNELLHEATSMERITPHPNIVAYHGCRVHRGRLTGIVLQRLEHDLDDHLQTPISASDIDALLAELRSAVDHIHSLGLAHNDIKPENIMINNGRPILIDFGSCRAPGRPGTEWGSAGTHGWFDESIEGSAKEHDVYALKKLREWLESKAVERAGAIDLPA